MSLSNETCCRCKRDQKRGCLKAEIMKHTCERLTRPWYTDHRDLVRMMALKMALHKANPADGSGKHQKRRRYCQNYFPKTSPPILTSSRPLTLMSPLLAPQLILHLLLKAPKVDFFVHCDVTDLAMQNWYICQGMQGYVQGQERDLCQGLHGLRVILLVVSSITWRELLRLVAPDVPSGPITDNSCG